MAKLIIAAGHLALGAAAAGMLTGALEAQYWQAPRDYAALGYGALFAALATLFGPLFVVLTRLRSGGRQRVGQVPWGRRTFVVFFAFSTLVLVRFILWRDVYDETPGSQHTALAWAVAATLAVIGALLPLWRIGATPHGTADGRFDPVARSALMAWVPVAAVLLAFGLRVHAGRLVDSADDPARAAAAAHRKTSPREQPGVILVVADALRADAVGTFGAPLHRGTAATPQLDAFAREALQFDNAVAQASWSKPAVASMLTGRSPDAHLTVAKADALADDVVTLGQVLQQHDVSTSAVMTNHNLGRNFGFAHGFDSFDYLTPDRYLGAPPQSDRLAVYTLYRLLRERYFAADRLPSTFYQPAQAVNARAFDLLDRIGPAPFFMYLHYMEAHDPYFAVDGHSYARVAMPNPTANDVGPLLTAYRDEVRRFDTAFGELWAGLVARGLDAHTLVVVVADHGEEFGEHGGFWHGTSLYEELVHVPLLLRGPQVKPGRTQALAQHIDLAPTIAHFLHAPVAVAWEGRNLLDPAAAVPAVSRMQENYEGNVLQAVRGGPAGRRLKHIVAHPDSPRGLPPDVVFDLDADPRERQPLAPAEAHAAATQLANLASEGNDVHAAPDTPAPNDKRASP
jgi:arylsulfatase A-like enzyme